MKKFARLLALVLACLMVATMLIACKDDPPPEDPFVYDDGGFVADDLPDDLKYNGEVIRVLHWEPSKPEFNTQGGADPVQQAVALRKTNIEDRLDVELDYTSQVGGNNAGHRDFLAYVKNIQESSAGYDSKFDLIAAYSRTAGSLATAGYFIDLKSLSADESYLNLEKPWWPKSIEETLDIGGKLMMVSGDASTNLLYQMQMVFFNKRMMQEYYGAEAEAAGFASATDWMYNKVSQGTWTIDEMIRLTEGLHADGNGPDSNTPSVDDYFGICATYYHVDSFYTGSGLKLIEKDAAKTLVISNDYGSQKTTDLVAKLGEWLSRSDAWTAGTDVSEKERLDNPTPFNEGRALFLPIRAQHIENTTMRENFKPGILPVPKYDTTQSEYYTAIGNAFTLYGITKSSLQRTEMGRTEASKMMTAVLECWGSEGYRRTTPQIYDNNFTGKLVENDTEAQMFDIIRSGIVIDLGRILGYELVVTSGQYPMSELPSQSICNYEAWSVNYNRYYSGMSDKLAELVGAIVWG